uniref:dCTP pyrophosphatase 1 n=1 Tax=Davidia involucrata TaxID=16924 RepID=A0A5B7B4Z3_DAVIN
MTGVSERDGGVTLDDLKKKMADFAKERDWDQFHSPRNLLLALVGEVGELSEIFQWRGEVPRGLPDWKEEEKQHLGEELSDVLLYLVRLSDICGVDLGKAALRKLELNAIKYPVKLCKGSSKKHTQINHHNNADNNNAQSNGYLVSVWSSNSPINARVPPVRSRPKRSFWETR